MEGFAHWLSQTVSKTVSHPRWLRGSTPLPSSLVTTVKTQTGSIYQIDLVNMEWVRVVRGKDSILTRTASGRLMSVPEIEVGKPMIFLCPPVDSEPHAREILTSIVTEII